MADYITQDITYFCSFDETEQPARVYRAQAQGRPLLVFLHAWSHGYRQLVAPSLEQWCVDNDWNLICPHFRGPSWEHLSCGHDAAVQDILDSVTYAVNEFGADASNVFLSGCSGGGYHSLLMAGRHPEVWKGVSAWVAISDIKAWHGQESARAAGYSAHIESVCGGNPQEDAAAAANAMHRSALTYLQPNLPCIIDINAGIHDGHNGSVPVSQSLYAFNALVLPEQKIVEDDIVFMTEQETIPEHLKFTGEAPEYGQRPVLFQKQADNIRVTLFEGGHEIVQSAVIHWLETFGL